MRGTNKPPLPERFWMRVNKEGPINETRPELGPCWIFETASTKRYAVVYLTSRQQVPAHRYAYEQEVGPVPEGTELDHLCRVRHCVRPSHLEPVVHAENCNRGDSFQRRQTHCKRGHYFDSVVSRPGRRAGKERRCKVCSAEAVRLHRDKQQISNIMRLLGEVPRGVGSRG